MFKEIINKSKIALETNEGKINGELLVNQSVESIEKDWIKQQ